MASAKKYRVNGTEHFNLNSMYEKLKCIEIDFEDGIIPWDEKKYDEIQVRITEIEKLMDAAPWVGSIVDWPTLNRIREIKNERQIIRYATCLADGTPESEAAMAFEI